MSLAYYITLEDKDSDIDVLMEGKALAHEEEAISDLCDQLDIPSIFDFHVTDSEMLEEIFDEDEMPEDNYDDFSGDEDWFEAYEGLDVVNSLISHIEKNETEIADVDGVLLDLNDIKRILSEADNEQIRWRLRMDI